MRHPLFGLSATSATARATSLLLGVVLGVTLAACASAHQQFAQQVQRIDAAWGPLNLADTQGKTVWMEEHRQTLIRQAAARHGYAFDHFDQAGFAFNLAVFERYDRREISTADTKLLVSEFWRRLNVERDRLALARAQIAANQWAVFWQGLAAFQQQQRYFSPVTCTTTFLGDVARTTCL